jgi:excinuclease ABC subunit A
MLDEIRVKKAAQHNLKRIDVALPRNRLIVVTGPSGSGKSSLAFDTLFAEGQRRYIECLSAYARQYIDQVEKPEVESIQGLSPAISIDQKTISSNPRSTVGTVTETYDLFRLLFARVGTPHCPRCGRPVSSRTADDIVGRIAAAGPGVRVRILSPAVRGRKGEYQKLLERWRRKGFLRARVDGRLRDLGEPIPLPKTKAHTIELLVDEFTLGPGSGRRVREAVLKALELSGDAVLALFDGKSGAAGAGREAYYSLRLLCPDCQISLPELEPRSFSFNTPYGACPRCHGIGFLTAVDEWGELEVTDRACPACGGSRLKPESLAVKVGGSDIHELTSLPVSRLLERLASPGLAAGRDPVASPILREIRSRLEVMDRLGMPYLQLSRTTGSLSGGEAQRVRLAAQVGARLRGVLYVLDEPTVGLHQRDNGRLIELLRGIRDDGNTMVVVEHDEQTIRAADHVLDLGPGAGELGGRVMAQGGLADVLAAPDSLTAQYLRAERAIPVPSRRREPKGWLVVRNAREHNLRGIDVRIPLSVLASVSGVSGSGKSTLVSDILHKRLLNHFHRAGHTPGAHDGIENIGLIDKVVAVDQKPIGRTPRSNPATYTGLFSPLRELMARTPDARSRGFGPGRFSFNVKGGRCDDCEGAGVRKVEMHFLPDVFVTCDRCEGRRYNKETLAVRYKGRTIADFLDLTVDEAFEDLKAHPVLKRKLTALRRVGLGYIRLGQPAPTLSGGEAQRIKLTKELGRRATGRTLYLLDEPTTGLHFEDVRKLLELLAELVDLGNTVLVIEHNLEVLKVSDYIIDLGPEGGEEGGRIVAQGAPEAVAAVAASHTGRFLKAALAADRRGN